MLSSIKPKRIISLFHSLLKNEIPGQLVIQITDLCNAKCPQCGMRITERYARHKLAPDDIKRILDMAALQGVQAVSFTGGEPFLLLDELVELIRYAGRAGIKYIRTGTNGFIFMNPDKQDFDSRIRRIAEGLASTPLRNLWISVDSAQPASHEQMRGFPGIIRGMEKALPIFHEHGIYPSANLGINRFMGQEQYLDIEAHPQDRGKDLQQSFYDLCREAFRAFYKFVIDLGFTMVNSCYPMSLDTQEAEGTVNTIYGANSEEHLVRFSPLEKALLFKAMFDTIPEFRSRVRIFSPRISLLVMYRDFMNQTHSQYPCHGGIDAFFISAVDGNTYPCGFRGYENLGKYWKLKRKNSERGSCNLCEWECFRDPSELFGPLLQFFHEPIRFFNKLSKGGEYRRVWLEDLKYYRSCHYFDGRRSPVYLHMQKY